MFPESQNWDVKDLYRSGPSHAKNTDKNQGDIKDLYRSGPPHGKYKDKNQGDVKDLHRNGPPHAKYRQTSRCHRSLQKRSTMLSIQTKIKEMSKISTEVVHHMLSIQTKIKISKISTDVVHHAKYKDTHQGDVKDLHVCSPP